MALTDNILGYWKLDESSGNAADSVGSNTGTATSISYGASYGIINNGASFTQGSSYIKMASFSRPTTASSYSFWMKTSTDGQECWGGDDSTSGNQQRSFQWHVTGNKIRFLIFIGATPYYYSSTTSVTNGAWHHVVGTHDGTTLKIYVDGSLQGSGLSASGTQTGGTGIALGILSDEQTNYTVSFNGYLDEVGIWSRALSSTEVTSLYNSGAGFQYPFSASSSAIKSINGLAKASIKSINGLAIASVKSFNGLA